MCVALEACLSGCSYGDEPMGFFHTITELLGLLPLAVLGGGGASYLKTLPIDCSCVECTSLNPTGQQSHVGASLGISHKNWGTSQRYKLLSGTDGQDGARQRDSNTMVSIGLFHASSSVAGKCARSEACP